MRRRACLVALAGGRGASLAHATPSADEQLRIERLIAAVGQRDHLSFVRNGSAHSAKGAAKFLREKLKARGAAVHTAQDFIDQIAARSSSSGQPCRIRFGDGRVVTSAQFLRAELARIDAAQATR